MCFNPHRPRRADATGFTCHRTDPPPCFNPHRPRRADATAVPSGAMMSATTTLFQSSPAPKGRCNHAHHVAVSVLRYVSILTGPEGPMQQREILRHGQAAQFQSSPAPKGRCNSWTDTATTWPDLFQSSPAPKGRCNADCVLFLWATNPFQSSPAPKGRCNLRDAAWVSGRVVSILTGPEGPMQPPGNSATSTPAKFQSSPAPKGRCNLARNRARLQARCFNPHRPRRADATTRADRPATPPRVSILTGPEGPMQPATRNSREKRLPFQSSPAPKGRCNPNVL